MTAPGVGTASAHAMFPPVRPADFEPDSGRPAIINEFIALRSQSAAGAFLQDGALAIFLYSFCESVPRTSRCSPQACVFARRGSETLDNDIEVEGSSSIHRQILPVFWQAIRSRPRPAEGFQDYLVAMRPIDERILQHRCWLDRGMIIKTLTGIRPERRRARIRPHIGAITSSFPERDVVDVRRCPFLKRGNGSC